MSLTEEASRSVQGAWGLLRRDPAAPRAFNATIDGFWRSFAPAWVLLPLILVYQSEIGPVPGTENAAPFTRWAVSILIYAIGWVLWPLLAFYLTRAMDCGERFVGYVVAYNWSQLITAPFSVGLVLIAYYTFAVDAAAIVSQIVLAAVLFYEYRIARGMLGVTPGKGALLVFASLLTGRLLVAFGLMALQMSATEST